MQKTMDIRCVFLLWLGAILFPANLMAHGVMAEVGKGGTVVAAKYDTGEPMSYAKVKIAAPHTKIPFQSGRTDRNGRFCFFPDIQGTWKLTVDDEIGHKLRLSIPVKKTGRSELTGTMENPWNRHLSRYALALMGVSIIFGLFGSVFGIMAYKRLKQKLQ